MSIPYINLLPDYDRWLDTPYQREIEAEEDPDEEADDPCVDDGFGDY